MGLVGICALLAVVRLSATETEQLTKPPIGPLSHETGRFRHESSSQPGLFFYCFFCPTKALMDSTYNYMQVTSCLNHYPQVDRIKWEDHLTEYEWKNGKYPFCNEGETPSCGPPPNKSNIEWECEPGYSGKNHSVYFSCKGRCSVMKEVQYYAYCNETLQWELTPVGSGVLCEERLVENADILILILIGVGAFLLLVTIAAFIIVCYKCDRKRRKHQKVPQRVDLEMQHVGRNNNSGNQRQNPYVGSPGSDPDELAGNGHQERQAVGIQNDVCLPLGQKNLMNGNPRAKVHVQPSVGKKGPVITAANPDETYRKQVVNEATGSDQSMPTRSVGMGTDPDLSNPYCLPKKMNVPHSGLGGASSTSSNTVPKSIASGRKKSKHASSSLTRPALATVIEQPHSFPEMSRANQTQFSTGSQYSPFHMSSVFGPMSRESSLTASHDGSTELDPQCSHVRSTSYNPSFERNDLSHRDINTEEVQEEDDVVDENTTLLPKDGADESLIDSERERLLSGQSSGTEQHSDFRRNSDEISEGNCSTGSSGKVPVEHELPTSEAETDIEANEKPVVRVMSKGQNENSDGKFHVILGEPFSVVAGNRNNQGDITKFIIQREDTGPAFRGKELTGTKLLPIYTVKKANDQDSGSFSWSLLSDRGNFDGRIEIIVENVPRDQPQGAENTTENTVETNTVGTVGPVSLKNQSSLPSQPFGNAPSLDADSVANDALLLSHGSQPDGADSQRVRTISEPDEEHQSNNELAGEQVKGETCDDDVRFSTLDPNTITDNFMTRQCPSGSSTAGEDSGTVRSPSGAAGDQQPQETSRKVVIEVTRPINCNCVLTNMTPELREQFLQVPLAMWKALALGHGIDETQLMALEYLFPNSDEFAVIKCILDQLEGKGLRVGHLMDYFCSHLSSTDSAIDALHGSDCPYCRRYQR